jgi:hypothetical protein
MLLETIRTVRDVTLFAALVVTELVLQRVTGLVWFGHGGILDWRK